MTPKTPADPKAKAAPAAAIVAEVAPAPAPQPAVQTPANARSAAAKDRAQTPEVLARKKAHARTPEGKAQHARMAAAGQTPEARAKRAATRARNKARREAGNMEDKMNEFIPGIVPGQQEFYHVEDDGMVVRWWIVPGTFGPSIYHPSVTDHPLGDTPRPGWYDANGMAVSDNPRAVVL